jgi:GNAT superfamily N-acetyltransferase
VPVSDVPTGTDARRSAECPRSVTADLAAELAILGGVSVSRLAATDLAAVQRLLDRSSVLTRARRFGIPVRSLPAAYACDLMQPERDHPAWVARIASQPLEVIALGSASAVRHATREVALLVETKHQRRGIGRFLLDAMVTDMCAAGTCTLVADIDREQRNLVLQLTRYGQLRSVWDGGTARVEVHLLDVAGCPHA